MKICLFGSSFNPPHIAHKQIVEGLKELGFDQVVIIPTGNPNHKKINITNTERMMLVAAFAKECDVDVSYHEVENEFAYTVESLDYLNFKDSDQVYLTIGGDSVNTLPTWDYFENLKSRVTFVIVDRPGVILDRDVLAQIDYIQLDIETTDVSSTELRNNLNPKLLPTLVYETIVDNGIVLK
ncbi:nicotinate-nicotinamide nucleotide adenylyltransferase [Mollicutes bacterium LVI A0078]|nr:nicotinate-nicotinamide nucleotide adenylyltransferase [Mollicutes bacterium LVI A0075]WOO91248.1 nicotinate-nicotinamide nucleotide adenylyltransferase [Mollicutes bacterium LVI A0078]